MRTKNSCAAILAELAASKNKAVATVAADKISYLYSVAPHTRNMIFATGAVELVIAELLAKESKINNEIEAKA